MDGIPHAHGVYVIRNTATGKAYVGSAARNTLRQRCLAHRSLLRRGQHWNKILQRAWNKYGEAGFDFGVLELCEGEACLAAEQRWMDALQAADRRHGYNLSPTARSPLGVKHTAATRAKWAEAQRLLHANPAYRAKLSESGRESWQDAGVRERRMTGHRKRCAEPSFRAGCAQRMCKAWQQAEHREKVRAGQEAAREKMAEANRKVWERPEHREKIILAVHRQWSDPERRARRAEASREQFKDPRQREMVSKCQRRLWSDPEYREKRRARMRARWADPEYRAMMIKARREARARRAAAGQ